MVVLGLNEVADGAAIGGIPDQPVKINVIDRAGEFAMQRTAPEFTSIFAL